MDGTARNDEYPHRSRDRLEPLNLAESRNPIPAS